MIDIGSKDCLISEKLSNFSEFHFEVEGFFCASMEGFLQSLKFPDVDKQKRICAMVGKKAKYKGKKKKWYLDKKLYWNGVVYDRFSKDYQLLLDKGFNALYQNSDYKSLLNSTLNEDLTHSIGKEDPNFTILTTEEFCSRLIKLRENGKL